MVDTERGDSRSATLSNAETLHFSRTNKMSIQNSFRLTDFAVGKYSV